MSEGRFDSAIHSSHGNSSLCMHVHGFHLYSVCILDVTERR